MFLHTVIYRCWEGLGAGGEGDNRGWDSWMATPTWWTWVWVNSRSWWWTGRPDTLQFMGSQRVGHDWVTELNWCTINFNSLLDWSLYHRVMPWKGWEILTVWPSQEIPQSLTESWEKRAPCSSHPPEMQSSSAWGHEEEVTEQFMVQMPKILAILTQI